MAKKVFISTTSFGQYDPAPLVRLKRAGFEVSVNPHGRKLTGQEVVMLASDAVGLIAGTEKLSAENLAQLKSLKVISRVGVGLDNVDLAAAKKLHIKVFNTPEGPTWAVAELTVGLMLNILRDISRMDRELRQGKWEKHMGYLLRGKTVGIIGFGRIGQAVGKICLALGARVCFHDPFVKKASGSSMTRVGFSALLKKADIVTLHLFAGKENVNLLSEKEFAMMKKGAFLVNCSRGGIVDEKALCAALEHGHLAGAAVDVFDREPYQGPLLQSINILLTPHVGSYAREARSRMETQAVENLIKGFKE